VYHHMSNFTTPQSLTFDVKRVGATFNPMLFETKDHMATWPLEVSR